MKRESIENIKKLLQKYDEGKSSVEEENILIHYFNGTNVAEELAHYQSEFNYYDSYRKFSLPNSFDFPGQNASESLFQKLLTYFTKWYVMTALIGVSISAIYFLQQEDKKTKEIIPVQNEPKEIQSDNIAFNKEAEEERDKGFNLNSDSILNKESKNNIKSNPKKLIPKTNSTKDKTIKKNIHSNIQKKQSTRPIKSVEPTNFKINQITNITDNIDTITANQPSENEELEKFQEMNFTITETTSSSTLSRMIYFARNAGISTTYEVDRHRKKIHEINIEMIILETGELAQIWIAVPKKSSFSVSLIWKEDKNGRAVSLFKSYIKHDVKPKHPLH